MSLFCWSLAMLVRYPVISCCLDGQQTKKKRRTVLPVIVSNIPKGFNVQKLWTIFTRCITRWKSFRNAFFLVVERLERYETNLSEYLSASLLLSCGTSSVGTVSMATLLWYTVSMSKSKGCDSIVKPLWLIGFWVPNLPIQLITWN